MFKKHVVWLKEGAKFLHSNVQDSLKLITNA